MIEPLSMRNELPKSYYPLTLDEISNAREIIHGMKLIRDNVQSLFDEACLLADNGHLARAFTLFQLLNEESAKVEVLAASIIERNLHKNDIQKIMRRLQSHSTKNKINAYSSIPMSTDEYCDPSIFKNKQNDFHCKFNTLKNASLYVDFQNGSFETPLQKIKEKDLKEVVSICKSQIIMCNMAITVVEKYITDPEKLLKSVEPLMQKQMDYVSSILNKSKDQEP